MDPSKGIPPRGSRRSNLRCGMSSMTYYNSIMRSPFIYSYVYIIYTYYILYIMCIYIYVCHFRPRSFFGFHWILSYPTFKTSFVFIPFWGEFLRWPFCLASPQQSWTTCLVFSDVVMAQQNGPHPKMAQSSGLCSIWSVSQKLGTTKIWLIHI